MKVKYNNQIIDSNDARKQAIEELKTGRKTTNKTYSDAIKQASENTDEQFTQLPLFRIATLTIPLLHSDHTVTMHQTPCVIANDTVYYSTTDGIRHAIPLHQIDDKNIEYIDEDPAMNIDHRMI